MILAPRQGGLVPGARGWASPHSSATPPSPHGITVARGIRWAFVAVDWDPWVAIPVCWTLGRMRGPLGRICKRGM